MKTLQKNPHFFLMIFLGIVLSPLTRGETPAVQKVSGGWGPSGRYQSLYESGAPARIDGKVLSMDSLVPLEGMEPGWQLRVDTGDREVDVHLGPRWLIFEHDVNFTRGEAISIVGVKIQILGKSAVIANEVSRPGGKVILRELSGTPRWSDGTGHRIRE